MGSTVGSLLAWFISFTRFIFQSASSTMCYSEKNQRFCCRLASTDQRLATMTSQLERIEDERSNHERALQARINRNKNSINDLRSTYFDFEQHARCAGYDHGVTQTQKIALQFCNGQMAGNS